MAIARRNYAYGIFVNGRKRVGGTTNGDTMDAAVRGLLSRERRRDTLTVQAKPSVYRWCDGATVPQADWIYNGQRANVCVWAPPEYFTDPVPTEINPPEPTRHVSGLWTVKATPPRVGMLIGLQPPPDS